MTKPTTAPQTISLDRVRELEEPCEDDWLNQAEKLEWAQERRAFHITKIESRDTDSKGYDPSWTYYVDDGELPRRIGLGKNARRNREAQGMILALMDGSRIGPVTLAQEPLASGKSTWVFRAAVADIVDTAQIPFD